MQQVEIWFGGKFAITIANIYFNPTLLLYTNCIQHGHSFLFCVHQQLAVNRRIDGFERIGPSHISCGSIRVLHLNPSRRNSIYKDEAFYFKLISGRAFTASRPSEDHMNNGLIEGISSQDKMLLTLHLPWQVQQFPWCNREHFGPAKS